MPTLSLKGVSKTFDGAVVALDRVDLDATGSHILGIVGPSGSGKSTLLRVIAGLEPLTSGHVSIDGTIVDGLAPKDRDVALMFQEHTLFPHMTVAANLGFGLRLRGVARPDIDRKVGEAARTLGLEALLERFPDQLSGGERQRVALGRALVRRPKLLLLDEPLSSVDAQLRGQLRGEIARTCRAIDAILIIVTHDQLDAMSMADRIAVMRRGRIEQVGDATTLYERPANRFVGEFIGLHGMNFFEGRVERGGAGLIFVHAAFTVGVPSEWEAAVASAGAGGLVLGIRPEGLRLAARPDGPGASMLAATVDTVERFGPQAFVHVTLAGRRCTALADPRSGTAPGDRVHFSLDPAAIRFFTEDGRAL